MSKGRFPLSRDSGNQASKDSCQSSATDNLLLNGVKIVAPDDESLNGNEAEMLKNNFCTTHINRKRGYARNESRVRKRNVFKHAHYMLYVIHHRPKFSAITVDQAKMNLISGLRI